MIYWDLLCIMGSELDNLVFRSGDLSSVEPLYFSVHRLGVDAYSLQHPDVFCRSAKFLFAHLAGMGCGIEYGRDPEFYRAIQHSLNGSVSLERPEPSAFRGAVTILDVIGKADLAAHRTAVFDWVSSAWEAWETHHKLARIWLKKAVEESNQWPKSAAA